MRVCRKQPERLLPPAVGRLGLGLGGRRALDPPVARAKGCNGVDIPVSPELAAALDAMPASDHLTYLVLRNGEPYSPEQLGCKFAD
ncbi:MAG TPA: hypothetical protein VGI22_21975 [Xanthobacteraceae bacterium]|jgi:hypothetical protein